MTADSPLSASPVSQNAASPGSASGNLLGSASLREAARQMRAADKTWIHAVADWLDDEAVHARHAEHRADAASNEVYVNVNPAYPPSTERAIEVAAAWLAYSGVPRD